MPQLAIWLPAVVVTHLLAVVWTLQAWWRRCHARTRPKVLLQSGGLPAIAATAPACFAGSRDHLPVHQLALPQALLTWSFLSVQVQGAHAARTVLAGVSGACIAGELHLLLGPSGAGKSTLLDLLAYGPSKSHSTETAASTQPRHSKATVKQTTVSGCVTTQAGTLWRTAGAQQLPPRTASTSSSSSNNNSSVVNGAYNHYTGATAALLPTASGGKVPGACPQAFTLHKSHANTTGCDTVLQGCSQARHDTAYTEKDLTPSTRYGDHQQQHQHTNTQLQQLGAAAPSAKQPALCLIPQHDLLLPYLTTWETLTFALQMAAAAGVPGTGSMSKSQQQAALQQLMDVMGLASCSTTQVGGVLPGGFLLRGLSGGERKRLVIATSLMPHLAPNILSSISKSGYSSTTIGNGSLARHSASASSWAISDGSSSCCGSSTAGDNVKAGAQTAVAGASDDGQDADIAPLMLLCDEPTSGLDSRCAMSVMQLLRQVAGGACSVLAALHQPRPAIWALFDMVSVLCDGQLLYYGPCGRLATWMEQTTDWGAYMPSVHGSPPEYVLEGACGGFQSSAATPCCSSGSESHVAGTVPRLQVISCHPGTKDSISTATGVARAADAFARLLATHGLLWWLDSTTPSQACQKGEEYDKGVLSAAVQGSMLTPASFPATAGKTSAAGQRNASCKAHQAGANDAQIGQYSTPSHSSTKRVTGPDVVTGVPVGTPLGSTASRNRCVSMSQTDVCLALPGLLSHASGNFSADAAQKSSAIPGSTAVLPVTGTDGSGTSASNTVSYRLEHSLCDPLSHHTARTQIELVASCNGDVPHIHIHASTHIVHGPEPLLKASCVPSLYKALRQATKHAAAFSRSCLARASNWFKHTASAAQLAARHAVLLTRREYLQLRADGLGPALKVLMFAWSAITMGLVFWGLDTSTGLYALQLRSAAMFMGCSILITMPFTSLLAYTAHAAHARQEARQGGYGSVAYYLSKIAATLPLHILCTVAYCTITYGMQGLRPDVQALGLHVLLGLLLVLCAAQVMHLAIVACPSPDTAFCVTTIWAVVNMFLSGFFIQPDQLQLRFLKPLQLLSAVRLAFQGMLRVELSHAQLSCGTTAARMDMMLFACKLLGINTTSLLQPSNMGALLEPSHMGALLNVAAVAVPGSPDAENAWLQQLTHLTGSAIPMLAGDAQPQHACVLEGDALLQLTGVDADMKQYIGGLAAYWLTLQTVTLAVQIYKWRRM